MSSARNRADGAASAEQAAPGPVLDIATVAAHALRSTGYPQLWEIECELKAGVLILRGVVQTYYLKQVAQSVVMGTSEAQAVENRIEVLPNQRGIGH